MKYEIDQKHMAMIGKIMDVALKNKELGGMNIVRDINIISDLLSKPVQEVETPKKTKK